MVCDIVHPVVCKWQLNLPCFVALDEKLDEISLTFERVGHLSRGKPTNPHSIGQQRAFDVNFWSAVKGSDSKFKPVVREVRRNLKQTEDRNPNIFQLWYLMNLKEVDISSFWCQFKLSSKKDLIQGSCIWQMRDWNILRAAHPPWGQSLSNPWTILIQSTDQQHVTTPMLNDILSLFLNRSLSPKSSVTISRLLHTPKTPPALLVYQTLLGSILPILHHHSIPIPPSSPLSRAKETHGAHPGGEAEWWVIW